MGAPYRFRAIRTTSMARTTPAQKPRGLNRIIFLAETTGAGMAVVIGKSIIPAPEPGCLYFFLFFLPGFSALPALSGFAGASALKMSDTAFHDPSACFLKTVTHLPSSIMTLLVLGSVVLLM